MTTVFELNRKMHLGSELRLITKIPTPTCFESYEPFIVKGKDSLGKGIGCHLFSSLIEADIAALDKNLSSFFQQEREGGFWWTHSPPTTVLFSLSQSCISPTNAPAKFGLFLDLCNNIGVNVFVICNRLEPIVTQASTHADIFQASQTPLPAGEITGGINRALRDPKLRMEWFEKLCTTPHVDRERIALVSDHSEDLSLLSLCKQRVWFHNDKLALPVQGHVASQDCSYLSLLFFGRELSSYRRYGY